MKNPKPIANMLTSFTKRHGIRAQLTAHDIVEAAQRELMAHIENTPLFHDMLVLFCKNDVITFACKHAAARFDAEGVAQAVCRALEPKFPTHTFRAECIIRPEAWKRI